MKSFMNYIQRLTNNDVTIDKLPIENTPLSLLDYKIQKSNISQYGQLTGGQ